MRDKGFSVRIAPRRPKRPNGDHPKLRFTAADIRERQSIATAVEGAFGVVNAVSLYVERGTETLHAVHVVAAERVAEEARKAGVERIVHISGIGASAHSSSPYIRARGQGEQAVRAALASAEVIWPAVMFGPDDAFPNALIQLLRRLPVYPMFGRGETRLQPADVEDVGEAVARLMQRTGTDAITVECGGPRVYSYAELLRTIARAANVRRILVPCPLLPGTPGCGRRNPAGRAGYAQSGGADADRFRRSGGCPRLCRSGISPRAMEEVLQSLLRGA